MLHNEIRGYHRIGLHQRHAKSGSHRDHRTTVGFSAITNEVLYFSSPRKGVLIFFTQSCSDTTTENTKIHPTSTPLLACTSSSLDKHFPERTFDTCSAAVSTLDYIHDAKYAAAANHRTRRITRSSGEQVGEHVSPSCGAVQLWRRRDEHTRLSRGRRLVAAPITAADAAAVDLLLDLGLYLFRLVLRAELASAGHSQGEARLAPDIARKPSHHSSFVDWTWLMCSLCFA